ncbi:hypothetical protein EVAR_24716_1 [Eumeta japonica]|uniref:Uncharacterized protein n=1 Tax=Eumeta variegata TaxID=151549 RepID=A0A4C1VDL1_EUMVA|nr:hypothetical protein EVAR_24716_1 [Eumeta japonica]
MGFLWDNVLRIGLEAELGSRLESCLITLSADLKDERIRSMSTRMEPQAKPVACACGALYKSSDYVPKRNVREIRVSWNVRRPARRAPFATPRRLRVFGFCNGLIAAVYVGAEVYELASNRLLGVRRVSLYRTLR